MTQPTSFNRKIVYLVILIPIMLVNWRLGFPLKTSVDATGVAQPSRGGVLAQQRVDMGLADAQIGEIDPASTTMKLATFGMRGVAISILWYRANEAEKRDDWNNVVATGNQIVLLEPHFTRMWEFLGWKLAYNASATFDDYRERYRWVIRGFDFLTQGLEYNREAAKLYKNAGWTISQKIGIADEKEQYRRLLRYDEAFGKRYDCTLESERDNWMLGRRWYHEGERLVLRGVSIGNESDFLFFSHSRLNLFNHAMWVQKDGIFGNVAKEAWANAGREWIEFGQMDLSTAIDNKETGKRNRTTLAKFDEITAEEERLTAQLRSLVPDLYKTLCLSRWEQVGETPGQQASLYQRLIAENASDELTLIRDHLDATDSGWRERFKAEYEALFTEEQRALRQIPDILLGSDEQSILGKGRGDVEQITQRALQLLLVRPEVLVEEIQDMELPRETKQSARSINRTIESFALDRRMSSLFQDILNYQYRLKEYVIEQTDEADEARRLRHIGREAYHSGETRRSMNLWLESMDKWNALFQREDFRYVAEEPLYVSHFVDMLDRFIIILDAVSELFPPEFGLQGVARHEMTIHTQAPQIFAAQEYAKKTFEQGDFEKSKEYFERILNAWGGVNLSHDFFKLAPLPELNEAIVEAQAYYLRSLEGLGEAIPDEPPQWDFVELLLRYDPKPLEAQKSAQKGATLLQDKDLDAAEAELAKAQAIWKELVERYPLIRLSENAPFHTDVQITAELHERASREKAAKEKEAQEKAAREKKAAEEAAQKTDAAEEAATEPASESQ